jgi:hypothetical protein
MINKTVYIMAAKPKIEVNAKAERSLIKDNGNNNDKVIAITNEKNQIQLDE